MTKTIIKKQSRYKKEDYQVLAYCVRSSQLRAKQVQETIVYNHNLAKWYKMTYLMRK